MSKYDDDAKGASESEGEDDFKGVSQGVLVPHEHGHSTSDCGPVRHAHIHTSRLAGPLQQRAVGWSLTL